MKQGYGIQKDGKITLVRSEEELELLYSPDESLRPFSGGTYDDCRDGYFGNFLPSNSLEEMKAGFRAFVREEKWLFMAGECWHIALAIDRRFKQGMKALCCKHGLKETVVHVFGCAGDRIVDAIGAHRDLSDFSAALRAHPELEFYGWDSDLSGYYLRPITRSEIFKILNDLWEPADGKWTRPNWENSSSYPLAAKAEAFINFGIPNFAPATFFEFAQRVSPNAARP